jgi:hypothetical protein
MNPTPSPLHPNRTRSRARFLALALSLLATTGCSYLLLSQKPPYPPSALIEDIHWDFAGHISLAPGSDLWPSTWGADGEIYTSWGDGGGFGGTNNRGRVSLGFARLAGSPENVTGINLWGGYQALNPSTFRGKCAGMISVGGVLYAWINTQNGHPPDVRLAWSADRGATWKLSDWAFPSTGSFFPATFINFGRDNDGAQDDFVYSYGARWIYTQGPEDFLYLTRVHQRRLTDRAAYEFFAGMDENHRPRWDRDVEKRVPVFSDPNGVGNTGLAHAIFHPVLQRYLLTVGHRPPVFLALTNAVQRLGIFDAPHPWGPWTTVAYYEDWGDFGDGEALGYSFPLKWIEPDGRTLWMVFSSTGELDSFNLIRLRLIMK